MFYFSLSRLTSYVLVEVLIPILLLKPLEPLNFTLAINIDKNYQSRLVHQQPL